MTDGYIQMRAALSGSFQYEIEAARGNIVNAIGLAMEELADGLVETLRFDLASSGLKNANRLRGAAWRRKLYGVGLSMEPAAQIFSKVPLIISAFESGQTIRAKGASGLLIPNPDVWPGGRVRLGRRASAASLWQLAEAKFGPLQVVRRPGKATLVVATVRESRGKAGGFRKASASAMTRLAAGKANGLATVVVFVIAKQAVLPRLLKSRTIKTRAAADAPRRLDTLFLKYFSANDGKGPRRLGFTRRAVEPPPFGFKVSGEAW